MSNADGYSDPTAEIAIDNVMNDMHWQAEKRLKKKEGTHNGNIQKGTDKGKA